MPGRSAKCKVKSVPQSRDKLQRSPVERAIDQAVASEERAPSWFRDLPPVKLYRNEYAAHAGVVGIDAAGRMLVEAGEDFYGEPYVSVIALASELEPEVRRAIAKKMIGLWSKFGEGGE